MKTLSALCLSLLVLAFGASCASTPMSIDTAVLIELSTQSELKASFGSTFQTNPYLDPIGMIRGKTTEFVVLRIDLALAANAHVSVDGRVKSLTGENVAQAQDRGQMRSFWSMWETQSTNADKRLTSLERSYLPDYSFVAKPGRRTYYLVLMGKYPLPRPATVEAYLNVEGLEPVVFEAPLPELPSKK